MDKRIKKVALAKKLTAIVVKNYIFLGTFIMITSVVIFVYSLLWDRYERTAEMAKSISGVLQTSADVTPLVDAVLAQERTDTEEFKKLLTVSAPTDNEGQLLSYKWYTEENPPLAKREDYKETADILLSYNSNFEDINGTSLMVFDKKTHIAALLCDVEKFGEKEPVVVDYMMWRTFEDVELDKIENERGSLFKNLYHYMKVDLRYVAFAWYEPYPYPDEDVVVFIEADSFYKKLWNNIFGFVAVFFAFLILVVFLMAFFNRKRMYMMTVEPVNKLSDAAKNYVEGTKKTLDETEKVSAKYFASLGINTGDEYEELSHTLEDMENKILDYEEDLKKITEERARLATELSIATRIQSDMLPCDFTLFVSRDEIDIHASMTPAKEVGGDFYDMFFLDERHLCMVMADVAGKGIPAALFMVRAMTTIKSRAKEGGTPAEILFDVNNELTEDNKAKIFVTVWLGILDMETGVLTESNAGHENPAVGYEGRPYEYIKTKHGFVLGGRKNMKYRDDSISLEPGSTLFIYTDGVLEATDIKGERFYNDRLLEALNKAAGQKPRDIISHVGEEIRGFVKDAPQFDDMTMLAVRWQGKKKDKLPGGSL